MTTRRAKKNWESKEATKAPETNRKSRFMDFGMQAQRKNETRGIGEKTKRTNEVLMSSKHKG